MKLKTIDGLPVRGKRVLVRADLNVPVKDGQVTDRLRLERQAPTVRELADKGARVIVLSHFGRPHGQPDPAYSLKPVAPAFAEEVGRPVAFAPDCGGPKAQDAVAAMKDGDVLLLENTRFHAGEEKNDPAFVKQLAALGDIFVNDAFSAAHRAHASTAGLAEILPAYAGRAMEKELSHLERLLRPPKHPMMVVVGGSKVSSKIALLESMVTKIETLMIGGAMANTFLAAQGLQIGRSRQEPDCLDTARKVIRMATEAGCDLVLPTDLVVAGDLKPGVATRVVAAGQIARDEMALDVGPQTIAAFQKRLAKTQTLVWNGPLGAFETPPFQAGTAAAARAVAQASRAGQLLSVAGGGDTVAALDQAGVAQDFTYVSAAGGAFLEWLEDKPLPGVKALTE